MLRVVSTLLLALAAVFITACQSTSAPTVNNSSNAASSNRVVSSPTPVNTNMQDAPPTNAIPGNSANAANLAPSGNRAAGFPDPRKAAVKSRPGATPTPGIPDAETLRRQMQGLESPNTNAQLAPPGGGMMMMKKKPVKPGATPTP